MRQLVSATYRALPLLLVLFAAVVMLADGIAASNGIDFRVSSHGVAIASLACAQMLQLVRQDSA